MPHFILLRRANTLHGDQLWFQTSAPTSGASQQSIVIRAMNPQYRVKHAKYPARPAQGSENVSLPAPRLFPAPSPFHMLANLHGKHFFTRHAGRTVRFRLPPFHHRLRIAAAATHVHPFSSPGNKARGLRRAISMRRGGKASPVDRAMTDSRQKRIKEQLDEPQGAMYSPAWQVTGTKAE